MFEILIIINYENNLSDCEMTHQTIARVPPVDVATANSVRVIFQGYAAVTETFLGRHVSPFT